METDTAAERRSGGPTEYRAIYIYAGRAGEGVREGTGAEGVRRHAGAGAARHGRFWRTQLMGKQRGRTHGTYIVGTCTVTLRFVYSAIARKIETLVSFYGHNNAPRTNAQFEFSRNDGMRDPLMQGSFSRPMNAQSASLLLRCADHLRRSFIRLLTKPAQALHSSIRPLTAAPFSRAQAPLARNPEPGAGRPFCNAHAVTGHECWRREAILSRLQRSCVVELLTRRMTPATSSSRCRQQRPQPAQRAPKHP